MTSDEPDPVEVLMDLARNAHNAGESERSAATAAPTPEGRSAAEGRAAAYEAAASDLRATAKWLDGEYDKKPAAVTVGERLRADEGGVPWRDDDDE